MIQFAPELAWQKQAACREAPTAEARRAKADKFFPAGRPSNEPKRMCADCPVVQDCLQWALEYDETGIWGGTTDKERSKMKMGAAA